MSDVSMLGCGNMVEALRDAGSEVTAWNRTLADHQHDRGGTQRTFHVLLLA